MQRITSPIDWLKLLVGLAAIFALFQFLGAIANSQRGEAGILIAALVVGGVLAVERWLFRLPLARAAFGVGLGRPTFRGVVAAAAVSVLLLLTIAAVILAGRMDVALASGSLLMLPGLFAQAGIAEETLFRGYLFGHLIEGRSFWRAALLAMLPFAAVHLALFATLAWPVALASVLLAIVMSFPLARLYVLGGRTIWAPALVHFVAQGALKLLVIPDENSLTLALAWISACATLPFLVFLVPLKRSA